MPAGGSVAGLARWAVTLDDLAGPFLRKSVPAGELAALIGLCADGRLRSCVAGPGSSSAIVGPSFSSVALGGRFVGGERFDQRYELPDRRNADQNINQT